MTELQKFKRTMSKIYKVKTLNQILRLYHPKLIAKGYEVKACGSCHARIISKTSFAYCNRKCQQSAIERRKRMQGRTPNIQDALRAQISEIERDMWSRIMEPPPTLYGLAGGAIFGGISTPDPLDADELHDSEDTE